MGLCEGVLLTGTWFGGAVHILVLLSFLVMLVKCLENTWKLRGEYLLYIKKRHCMPRNKKKTPYFQG